MAEAKRATAATATILIADLPPVIARTLTAQAIAAGLQVTTSPSIEHPSNGVALRAYPLGGPLPVAAGGADVAVGWRIGAQEQAEALRDGAVDVLDMAWAPELVSARLAQLVERRALHHRLATHAAAREREMADARALQLALVPPAAVYGSVEVDVVLEPAMELGGDLVDHLRIADGRIMLALGDVSGKGAPAALTMARTHTLLRSLALRSYAGDLLSPPSVAAKRLNGMLAIDNERCMFVTMFLGLLDARTGRLSYVRCGQIPPFLRRSTGAVERLDAVGNLPLGVLEDADYEVAEATLMPGDTLLVISDGVTEAEAPDGRLLGEEPVLQWLSSPRLSIDAIVQATRAHEAGGDASDDLSALIVRFG